MTTEYYQRQVIRLVYGTASASRPTYYLGLSKTAPTASGTNVSEPASSTGYARIALQNLTESSASTVTNSAAIMFPESNGDWGVMTHFVIFDAATGGHLLMYGALPRSRSIEAQSTVTLAQGALTLSITDD